MARFLFCVCLAFVSVPAFADTAQAATWAKEASVMQARLGDLIMAAEAGDKVSVENALALEITAFADTAKALGAWNDAHQGPMDLGCIFRGLGEDATRQMKMLETATSPEATLVALKRLQVGFEDAALIGADAAKTWAQDGLGATGEEMLVPCSGDPLAVLAAE
jgi:hypothetical protein